jgi:hypothetical protein
VSVENKQLLSRLEKTSPAAHPELDAKYRFSADGQFFCDALAWGCPANCNADGSDPTGDSDLDDLHNTFALEKPGSAKHTAAIDRYDAHLTKLRKLASAAKKAEALALRLQSASKAEVARSVAEIHAAGKEKRATRALEKAVALSLSYELWEMSVANGLLREEKWQQGAGNVLGERTAVFYADASGAPHIGALIDYSNPTMLGLRPLETHVASNLRR